MYKFFRGTTFFEAQSLGEGMQHKDITHWTDSLEKAQMYSKGAVIEVVLDELPPHFKLRKSIAEGNAAHGNIRDWRIPRQYYERDGGMYNYIEEVKIHLEGGDY